MKTITPFELQMLIDRRYVEVIDFRLLPDFKKSHVFVARSITLKNFEPHVVLAHRRGEKDAPIYIIAERKAQACLVACGLASAGLCNQLWSMVDRRPGKPAVCRLHMSDPGRICAQPLSGPRRPASAACAQGSFDAPAK